MVVELVACVRCHIVGKYCRCISNGTHRRLKPDLVCGSGRSLPHLHVASLYSIFQSGGEGLFYNQGVQATVTFGLLAQTCFRNAWNSMRCRVRTIEFIFYI